MTTTINGKPVLSEGSTILTTGQTAVIQTQYAAIEVRVDESAPRNISVSGAPNGIIFSIDGMASDIDVSSSGSGTFGGVPMNFTTYVMRIANRSNGVNVYRFEHSLIAA